MSSDNSVLRIGIYGSDGNPGNERHGCGLWPAGHAASITYAGATPVPLNASFPSKAALDTALDDLHGVVVAEMEGTGRTLPSGEKLCIWCRDHELPLLAIDGGLHVLNSAFGGLMYCNLARELPEALQHRHPP